MKIASLRTPEQKFAVAGIALGFVISCILAFRAEPFLSNFEFYWGSQLVGIAIILLLRPRPAIVGALSVCMVLVLSGFKAWLSRRSNANPDGLVWLLYLVLLAGTAMGAAIGTYWLRGKQAFSWFKTTCIIAATAAAGCIISISMSCYWVFYCH